MTLQARLCIAKMSNGKFYKGSSGSNPFNNHLHWIGYVNKEKKAYKLKDGRPVFNARLDGTIKRHVDRLGITLPKHNKMAKKVTRSMTEDEGRELLMQIRQHTSQCAAVNAKAERTLNRLMQHIFIEAEHRMMSRANQRRPKPKTITLGAFAKALGKR